MSPVTAVDPAPAALIEPEPKPRNSRWLLLAGLVGRAWLWFVVGSLLITFVPLLFGWRPYVIVSGSMKPHISVGDVILASPNHDAQSLLGHVTVFDDPSRPGHIKSHRVIKVNDDGTLTTKGDANPTADSDPVPISAVRGMGRLMVRWVGLPLIWLSTAQWLKLALFLVSLLMAAYAVASDQDEEDEDDLDGDREADETESPDVPDDTSSDSDSTPLPIAASRRFTLPGGLQRMLASPLTARLALRAGVVVLGSAMLLLPTTLAAFGATTKNTADKWAVPNWDYTTETKALAPYLYWKLDETGTATSAADSSGNSHPGTYNNSGATSRFTRLTDGALVTDTPDNAVTLVNNASCINTTSTTLINSPAAVTVIIWFKTTNGFTGGGKLAGFEKPQVGVAAPPAGTYDRHLYMDALGHVWFGVYNGAYVTLQSTTALNDGAWHMAVGTVGATGTRLYIDGVLSASNTGNTAAEATTGVWRAGCGNLAGWGGANWGGTNNDPGTDSTVTANSPFLGSLDEFTVYDSQLTATNINFLYWIR
jgi:signal peptidase I